MKRVITGTHAQRTVWIFNLMANYIYVENLSSPLKEFFEENTITPDLFYQSLKYAVLVRNLVNNAPGKSLQELTQGIPHNKVGVTTVGDVRRAGGNVVSSPTRNNPNHATMSGLTAKQAENLMTPTVRNPSR